MAIDEREEREEARRRWMEIASGSFGAWAFVGFSVYARYIYAI